MFKTKIIPIFFILFIILLALAFRELIEDENVLKNEVSRGKLIAACSIPYNKYKSLIPYPHKIIETSSTAESMELMKMNKVDLVISSRTKLTEERAEKGFVLKKGYAFLSNRQFFVFQEELSSYKIFTDQDVDLIKDLFSLEEVEFVFNPYDFLDKGIVITSWDNFDYSKAELVHVFNNKGEVLLASRQPALYCLNSCEEGFFEEILSFLLIDQE